MQQNAERASRHRSANSRTDADVHSQRHTRSLADQGESFARITLPISASDLHAEFMANGNNTTVVKFSIPASDLALTLQQAGYVNGLSGLKDGSSSLQAHKDLPWWQLRQSQRLRRRCRHRTRLRPPHRGRQVRIPSNTSSILSISKSKYAFLHPTLLCVLNRPCA